MSSSKKSVLSLFIDQHAADMVAMVGKINYWYTKGCNDSTLSEIEKKFIEAVEKAYQLMTDTSKMSMRTTLYSKIMHMFDLNSMEQVKFILQVADALYLSNSPMEKRFKKAMIERHLLQQLEATKDDHKANAKFTELYIQLMELDKPIDENDNPIIETTIILEANPQLLERYNAADRQKTLDRIKRLELKAKAQVHGQE